MNSERPNCKLVVKIPWKSPWGNVLEKEKVQRKSPKLVSLLWVKVIVKVVSEAVDFLCFHLLYMSFLFWI